MTFKACHHRIAAALMCQGWRLWKVEVVDQKWVDWVLVRDIGACA
jgi:hypothetical protein